MLVELELRSRPQQDRLAWKRLVATPPEDLPRRAPVWLLHRVGRTANSLAALAAMGAIRPRTGGPLDGGGTITNGDAGLLGTVLLMVSAIRF